MIDIGDREIGSGMSYIAFSRAKRSLDYAIKFPIFSLVRLTRIKTHQQFKCRVAEDRRLGQLALATRQTFRHLVPPSAYAPIEWDGD